MTVELAAMPDYDTYVQLNQNNGWVRENITLDETNIALTQTGSLAAGGTGPVITVNVPSGQKVSIMGVQQIPRGADARSAHALRIRLANTADLEIAEFNKLRITKKRNSGAVTELARPYYVDANLTKQKAIAGVQSATQKTDLEWYRFKQGIEVLGTQSLVIEVQNLLAPDSIDAAHVTFALDLDLWTFGY
jgi:hypothetical protein